MTNHEKIVIRSPETPDEFAQYFHVRWKTLRAPWGQPEGSEKDEREDETLHRAAFVGKKIAGVAKIQTRAFVGVKCKTKAKKRLAIW